MSPMKQSKKRILKTLVATALIGSPVFAGDLQVARWRPDPRGGLDHRGDGSRRHQRGRAAAEEDR